MDFLIDFKNLLMINSQNLDKRQDLATLVKIYILLLSLPKLPILVAQLKFGKMIREKVLNLVGLRPTKWDWYSLEGCPHSDFKN